ncbi:hypothetical protein A8U91_02241 [Halomonas elongata]|uniref:Uncharacterized protein n=1 Tax=Halomonas elongata TaxID=2746 RepID=A0A1B8P6K5_HALEL|nr:hypothetical protein [Halomonas elongata]OBX37862.1 hypothetical protein A8U91_02241 [Halomonas elongata]
MCRIEIKTEDNELAKELQSLDIDGLKVGRRIASFDSAGPELMAAANQVATFVITSGDPIALSLFSSWLYDRLKSKKKAQSIKINGIEISGNNENLKVVIHNHIHLSDGSKSE